jgi:hypothetical protein
LAGGGLRIGVDDEGDGASGFGGGGKVDRQRGFARAALLADDG